MDAGECLLNLVNTFDGPITEWISGQCAFACLFSRIQAFPSDFTRKYFTALECDGGAALKAARHNNAPTPHATLNAPTTTPLLKEWAKATLAGRSWEDALVAAASVSVFFYSGIPRGIDTRGVEFVVSRFSIYRVICERLETIHHMTHASRCFRQMVDELSQEIQGEGAKWVLGK